MAYLYPLSTRFKHFLPPWKFNMCWWIHRSSDQTDIQQLKNNMKLISACKNYVTQPHNYNRYMKFCTHNGQKCPPLSTIYIITLWVTSFSLTMHTALITAGTLHSYSSNYAASPLRTTSVERKTWVCHTQYTFKREVQPITNSSYVLCFVWEESQSFRYWCSSYWMHVCES